MKNMFNKKVFSSWLLVFLTCLLLFNIINLKNNVMRYFFLHFFNYVDNYDTYKAYDTRDKKYDKYVYYTCNIEGKYYSGYSTGTKCEDKGGIFIAYKNNTKPIKRSYSIFEKYVSFDLDVNIENVEYDAFLTYNYLYDYEGVKKYHDTLNYSVYKKGHFKVDNLNGGLPKDSGLPDDFGFELVKERINKEILDPVFKDTKFTPNDWGMFNSSPMYYDLTYYRKIYE